MTCALFFLLTRYLHGGRIGEKHYLLQGISAACNLSVLIIDHDPMNLAA